VSVGIPSPSRGREDVNVFKLAMHRSHGTTLDLRLLTLSIELCVVVEGKLDGYRPQAHLVCLGALQLDKVFEYICCENIVF